MIQNITKDVVKILNFSLYNGEILCESMIFHTVLLLLLNKLKENRKIQAFYIEKSKILPYFKEIIQLVSVFPYLIIVSDDTPVINDEISCILSKMHMNFGKNIQKFYKFLKKHKLIALERAYHNEDFRFTLYINNIKQLNT